MRSNAAVLIVLLWLFSAGAACAQNLHYLPQVATGSFGSGSFRTTFVFFNNTDSDLTAVLKLTGDEGTPLRVTIGGLGTASEFNISIAAGATQIYQTDGSGALVVGSATVSAPARIGTSAIFTVYDSNGNYLTEAGVGNSEPMTDFVLPVDTTGLFNTGLALFNGGTTDAALTLVLRDTAGQTAERTTLTLRPNRHFQTFVAGVNQLFPSRVNFQGTLRVQSTTPIEATVLRENQTPLSYTSLPVVPASSTQLSQNLAHVVSGSFADGSFKTSFLLFNLASGAADVTLALTRDDGSPWLLTIPGRGTRNTFSLRLEAGASAFLQTDGLGPLAQGAASIDSSAPIGASAIFTVLDANGAFRTEAGVGNSAVLNALTLPVDLTGSFDTGVAFFNPGNSVVKVTLKLLDGNGALFDPGTTLELGVRNHTAAFISELFPGTQNFRGSLTIAAPGGVAALTLRQNSTPLSYTTLPVVPGLAVGKPLEVPLLSKTQTGLAATANLTVNETLPFGFRLTGQVLGSGRARGVLARRADGAIYYGEINAETGRYAIALAAGTYSLRVLYQPVTGAAWGSITNTYSDPSPVQVAADTTRHIRMPTVPLFSVSGSILGLATLPETADARVIFTSNDNAIEGSFLVMADGSFQGLLPNGSYKVSVAVPLISFTLFRNESLALFNLGSAAVNGVPLSLSLSIPATVKVSGSVRAKWLGAFAFGIRVSAADLSQPVVADPAWIQPPSVSSAQADPVGAYELILARGRAYGMEVSLPLLEGSRRLGTIGYALSSEVLNAGGDTAYNFNLPDLPGQVTISGRVTDSLGKGVGGASVVALAQGLGGAPGLSFAAAASTDAQGSYSMNVPGGTGYQLLFIPVLR